MENNCQRDKQNQASRIKPYGANYGLHESLNIFDFMCTDKPLDRLIGLYYFEARFYAPVLNRFISEDSKQGLFTDPLSLNKHIYVEDNPTLYTDPTGHWKKGFGGGGGNNFTPAF